MESAIFTRTRESDFSGDIADFPLESSATAEKELRRWFSTHGKVAFGRTRTNAGNAFELWIRTHDPDRRDRVGQRPILCVACLWSVDGNDIDQLSDLFARAITQPEILDQLIRCVHVDAAQAEQVGTSVVPAKTLLKYSLSQAAKKPSADEPERSLQLPICEDSLDNRVRMAAMSRRSNSFERLLIGGHRPPSVSMTGKTFVLLPPGEVERFGETMRMKEGQKSLVKRMKDMLSVVFIVATIGLVAHAYQLHQRLAQLEQKAEASEGDEDLYRRDLKKLEEASAGKASLDQMRMVETSVRKLEVEEKELLEFLVGIREQQAQLSKDSSSKFVEQAARLEILGEIVRSFQNRLNELEREIKQKPDINQ